MDKLHNSATMSRCCCSLTQARGGKLRGNHGQPEQLHALVRTPGPGKVCAVTDGDCAIVSWRDKVATVIIVNHDV